MDQPEATPDHKTLNALNEQIAAEQTRIADLERRIRVINIEVAGWKAPSPPTGQAPGSLSLAWVGFVGGFAVTGLLGTVIAKLVGR